MKSALTSIIATLSRRQCYRDDYRQQRDPIREDRLLSRVQAFRRAVDLLMDRASWVVETAVAISSTTSFSTAEMRGDC